MNKLPAHWIGPAIAFAVIGLAGGGLWFWSARHLDTEVAARDEMVRRLSSLNSRGFYPSEANLKVIQDNAAGLGERLAPLLPKLQATTKAFAEVNGPDGRGLDPDAWKKLLNRTREELRKRAEASGAAWADDFYFGFKRYRVANPPAGATARLGVQLTAIDHLLRGLLGAKVSEINEVRRVMVEDSEEIRRGASAGEEALQADVVPGPAGWYEAFPFELRFTCEPRQVPAALNAVTSSPLLFVIRAVEIQNEKSAVPRRTEVTGKGGAPAAGKEGAAKLLVPVAGREKDAVRLRVDLLLWKDKPAEAPPGRAPAKR